MSHNTPLSVAPRLTQKFGREATTILTQGEKDTAELTIIQNFVSKDAVNKSLDGKRAYVAAFSINSENPDLIISNALSSGAIDALLSFPEIFVIGVQVDA